MIDLTTIKKPGVEVRLLDGSLRVFDPFDIARRAEQRLGENLGLGEAIGLFRELLELSAEQATDYHVLALQKQLLDFAKQLVVGKAEPPSPQS